jgi:ABC-2 type transport system permease protein
MKRIKRFFTLYASYFRINITRYISYRVETVIWLVGMILPPVVLLSVWQNAASRAGGSIVGFNSGDIAAYFIVVMLVNHATLAWAVFLWESYVREGYLAYVLLRPHPVFMQDLAENVAFKIVTVPVMLLTGVGLWISFHAHVRIVPWALVTAIPAVLLAFALRYTMDWIVATTAALYSTKVDAVNTVFFFIMMLFSGQIAPLQMLPNSLRIAADFMPFRWMIDFPVQAILGRLTPQQVLTGLGAQMIWVTIHAALVILTWRGGIRRFTAVGL